MKYLTTVLFALTLAACGAPVNTEEGDAGYPTHHCSVVEGARCVDFVGGDRVPGYEPSFCLGYGGPLRPGTCPTEGARWNLL